MSATKAVSPNTREHGATRRWRSSESCWSETPCGLGLCHKRDMVPNDLERAAQHSFCSERPANSPSQEIARLLADHAAVGDAAIPFAHRDSLVAADVDLASVHPE